MAVVVSQGQNEIKTLADKGLDIRPHRARMNAEALDEEFKDPSNPLRLVFVCAMWMAGFDAPSVLDHLPRPPDAQPHADADHRPSQPGVPGQGQRTDRRLHRRVPGPGDEPSPSTGPPTPRRASTHRSRTSPNSLAALAESVDFVAEFCAALRRRPRRAARRLGVRRSSLCGTLP